MSGAKPRMILMCGLPCAGKTTEAKKLARELGAVRLCPDEWLAALGIDLFDEAARDWLERRLWTHAEELLASGTPTVIMGRRLAIRNGETGAAVITPELLAEYETLFEAPTRDELDRFDEPA